MPRRSGYRIGDRTPTGQVLRESVAAEEVLDDRAAAAASKTSDLLQRFRPGQSLDDEIEAFERAQAAASAEPVAAPEPVAPPVVEPEPVVVQEPAFVEPERAFVEPEPVAPLAAAPESIALRASIVGREGAEMDDVPGHPFQSNDLGGGLPLLDPKCPQRGSEAAGLEARVDRQRAVVSGLTAQLQPRVVVLVPGGQRDRSADGERRVEAFVGR